LSWAAVVEKNPASRTMRRDRIDRFRITKCLLPGRVGTTETQSTQRREERIEDRG
jgi:hypothetical protein